MKKKSIGILSICVALVLCGITYGWMRQYAQKNLVSAKEKPVLFGATYMTMNNPFYEVIDKELRNVVEANGDILITKDPQLSVEKQIHQIHQMMEEGIQVLIVNPVDSQGLKDVLQEAKAKGIVIIAIDTNIYHGENLVDYTVVSDNYQAGVLCARHVMKKMKTANIIVLTHESANSAVERIQGFKDTLQSHSAYRIVRELECEGQLEKSMPLIAHEIEKHTDFDVVMSLNDPAALGAVAALQEKGRLQDVMVLGVDGTPETKVLIKDGFMEGSVAQYPKQMAKKAISSAYQILKHHEQLPEEMVPVNMIDQSNIDDFSLEGWQ